MIKVLVVDNHPIVRTGLKLFFESSPDITVVGTLKSGIEIFEFVRRYPVDVIISEIDLPELNGITALRAIKKEHLQLKVIMFSHHPESIYALSTLKAGASGYLSKTVEVEKIKEAVYRVFNGGTYDPRKATSRMFKRLSTREVEVLKLLSSGKKNKEIAIELNINEKTVSTYKARLYRKLNVNNLVDLINQAKHMELY
jgi:DNA-binding NarL/FixJ family response regulator